MVILGREQPIHQAFIIMSALLALSPVCRAGVREVSGLGPPGFFVLANAKVRTGDMGQPFAALVSNVPSSVFPKQNIIILPNTYCHFSFLSW